MAIGPPQDSHLPPARAGRPYLLPLKVAQGLPLLLCQGHQRSYLPLAAQIPEGGGKMNNLTSGKWT